MRAGGPEDASREERAEEETRVTEDPFDRNAVPFASRADEAGSTEERRRRSVVSLEYLRRALEARGVTEEDILRDFEVWRKARRRARSRTGGPGNSAARRS